MKLRMYFLAAVAVLVFVACSGDASSAVEEIPAPSSSENVLSSETVLESSSADSVESSAEMSSEATSSSSFVEPVSISYGEVTDERDGHTYKTVNVNGVTWMAENLNYAYLQPTAELDSSSGCYNNEPDSCAKYGRLYLWSAAVDSAAVFSNDGKDCGIHYDGWSESAYLSCVGARYIRGACPDGWHIPDREEWEIVYRDLKSSNMDSSFLKTDYWNNGLFGYLYLYGLVMHDPQNDYFASDSLKFAPYSNDDVLRGYVRCVKTDTTMAFGEMTDERDGQTYRTVTIGGATWMAENLNYAYLEPTLTLDSSSFCYNNEPDSCAKYGRLYLYSAIVDSVVFGDPFMDAFYGILSRFDGQGICPDGWHLPGNLEMRTFWRNAGGSFSKNLLKSSDGIFDSGFSIPAAGWVEFFCADNVERECPDSPRFLYVNEEGALWALESDMYFEALNVDYNSEKIDMMLIHYLHHMVGYSVRCVKNEP